MDLNVADVKFQGEIKWKALPELELSALGAVRYQASSQEHNIKDHSNQATAYRTGMDDATIRDENNLFHTFQIIYFHTGEKIGYMLFCK